MNFKTYSLSKDDDGRRIDRILRRFLPDMPLSGVYRLLRKGLVRVDGKRVSPEFKVSEGGEIQIADSLVSGSGAGFSREETLAPESRDRDEYEEWILLETPDLLFINKPAGIPVHGTGGLSELIPQSSSGKESLSFRTGPLHRLDLGTTGIIVFSRSLAGARWFSEAISTHEIGKLYLGIAEGRLPPESRWVDTDENGKRMETVATALATSGHAGVGYLTLVLFRILTGRKHQIRKQSSSNGHPLSRDRRYGGHGAGDFYLHAWKLRLPESRPVSLPEEITAPLPGRFASRIAELFGDNALAHIEGGELYWGQNEEHQ